MNQKLLFFKTLFYLCILGGYSQCPTGDVLFTTQAEINNFLVNYPNCTEISGKLQIGTGTVNAITSLTPLSNLTTVQGELRISTNYSLTSLSGLENITSVGSLFVGYNSNQLTSLSGLNGLETITGNATIGYNDSLTTLTGLDNLQTIGGFLWIYSNTNLNSISSLNNLTTIANWLQIAVSSNMNSISGFQNLTQVSAITLSNLGITSINEFSNLNPSSVIINLINNTNLTDISGVQNINPLSITNLKIYNNPNLATCNYSNLCSYLANDSTTHPREIHDNTGNCLDEATVVNSCGTLSSETIDFDEKYSIYRQENSIYLFSRTTIQNVTIYDALGRSLYFENINERDAVVENATTNQILIVKLLLADGTIITKKIF